MGNKALLYDFLCGIHIYSRQIFIFSISLLSKILISQFENAPKTFYLALRSNN